MHGGAFFGGTVLTFRGASGIGASAKANVDLLTAASLNITTTQANIAIVVVNGDRRAVDGTSRAWLTGAGAFTEQTYFHDAGQYTVYGGYHADAGPIGTYTVGLSAPTRQNTR